MFKIEQGSSKSLFTLIAVVIFGIFLSLSYWMFQDEMKNVLASVVDGVSEVTVVKLDNTLSGKLDTGLTGEVEVVLVPNPEGDFTFSASLGMIQGYNGTRKDVVIPETIGGVPVKHIGTNVFYNDDLTSVYLPGSLLTIGTNSFRSCELTSIVIPEGVVSIGDYAFNGNSLTSITLPESLKTISPAAFYMNKLTNVYIPKGVTSLPSNVFRGNPMVSAEIAVGTTYVKSSPETFPIGTVVTMY